MFDIQGAKNHLSKAVDHFEKQLLWLQVWKASSSLVNSVNVSTTYGMMQLAQIANVSTPDSQTIKMEPWDKSNLSAIEKAIYDANMWLTPQNQGDYIMVKIPSLTEDRRKEVTKQVSRLWEEAKAVVRKMRQDEMKTIKRLEDDKEISEDDKRRFEKNVDDIVKEMNDSIDLHVKNKSAEVMKI